MAGPLNVHTTFDFDFILGLTLDEAQSTSNGAFLSDGNGNAIVLTGTFDTSDWTGTSTMFTLYIDNHDVATGIYAVDLADLLAAIASGDVAAIIDVFTENMLAYNYGGLEGTTVTTILDDEVLNSFASGNAFVVEHDGVTINAGEGADTLYAGTGTETLNGEGGNDTFVITSGAQVSTGDLYDGGDDTDTLSFDTFAGPIDVSGAGAAFQSIENILIAGGASVTFSASQFGSGKISDSVLLDTSAVAYAGIKIVSASNFSAAGWTFNLGGSITQLQIEGTAGADTITGSDVTFSDTIDGKGGGDVINGGSGNDNIFAYAGDTIDAGTGNDAVLVASAAALVGTRISAGLSDFNDRLVLNGGGTYDFSVRTGITGFDSIQLNADTTQQTIKLTDAFVTEANDDSFLHLSIVGARSHALTIDASTLTTGHSIRVTLANSSIWNNTLLGGGGDDVLVGGSGDDSIVGGSGDDGLAGGDGADSLAGGNGVDNFRAGTGTDTVDAGDGNDVIVFTTTSDVSALDSYDGGDGIDTLEFDFTNLPVNTNIYDVSAAGAVFHNIEKLHLTLKNSSPTVVTFSQTQFGSGLLSNALVVDATPYGSVPFAAYQIRVVGLTSFSADGWTLNSGNTDALYVQLTGASGTDSKTITGSDYHDLIDANGGMHHTLSGGDGRDTIAGWGGNSSLSGGAGGDYFVVESAADLVGTTIDGGVAEANTIDRLRLDGAGTYNFNGLAISRIDELMLNSNSAAFAITISDAMAATARVDGTETVLSVSANLPVTHGVTIDASSLASNHRLTVDGYFLNGNDTLTGGTGRDFLQSGIGNDSLVAGDGDDYLEGGEGNDTINGGDGNDLVYLGGTWLDYAISFSAGTYTITDLRDGHSGTDKVTNIEMLRYGSGDLAIANVVDLAPDAVADTNALDALVEAGTGVAGDAASAGNVLTNDSDANEALGDSFVVKGARLGASGNMTAVVSGGTQIVGVYGTLTIKTDGSYSYALNNADADTNALAGGAVVSDVFNYYISDLKGLKDTAALTFTITGSNDAPVITSNGGASLSLSRNENATAVTTVIATDVDGPTRVWSLSGDDAARFNISSTGVVTFKTAPNREAPTDLNHDNVYKVIVRVSDGSLSDTQALSITVNNVNEAPAITSNGAGTNAAINVNENATAVTTVVTSDVDGPSKIVSLSGADASLFKISSTGVVTFKIAPDFEAPGDAGKNNVYNVTVKVSDGSLFDTQNLAITVKNVAGNSFVGTAVNDTIDLTHKISGKGATIEADKIDGKAGNDTIRGSGGDDTLIGGDGNDLLVGDAGKDKFLFNAKLGPANIDRIGDFTHDSDLIQLDDAIFKTLGGPGALASIKFWAAAGATAAHDSNDRIVYDKTTGKLYVDDDGIGGHAAVHFATLSTKPPLLDAGDFAIV